MHKLRKDLKAVESTIDDRWEILESIRGRLVNEAGFFFDQLNQQAQANPPLQTGFWSGVRMLFPVIEAVANVLDDNPDYRFEFMKDELNVPIPHIVWDMYRHTLLHHDYPASALYQGKKLRWGISIGDGQHLLEVADPNSGAPALFVMDVLKLYQDLLAFLVKETTITKDTTQVEVLKTFEYLKASTGVVSEFGLF